MGSDTRQQSGRLPNEKSNNANKDAIFEKGQHGSLLNSQNGALCPSQLLPQSPLLTKPRNQTKERKRPPTKEDVDRLRRNPWAVALASPPRYCIATGTRLPKAFLGDYGLVRPSEEDESLWFMPVGLLKDELKTAASKTQKPVEIALEEEINSSVTGPKPDPLRIPSIRIVDRLRLLKEATRLFLVDRVSRRKKSAVGSIIPFRWRHPHGPLNNRSEKNLIWREDMPEFVLENMRKEVLKELEKVCRQNPNINTADGVWTAFGLPGNSETALINGLKELPDIKNMESGGVLIMGTDHGKEQAVNNISPASSSGPFVSHFPDYITLPLHGTKVPVFDLSVLLSEEDLDELRKLHPRFQESALYFRPGGTTPVEPMLALWRLKGYVMYDNQHPDQD